MNLILNSVAFWQWVIEVLIVFFLVGGLVAIVVGVSLIANSEKTLRFFSTLNHWKSARKTVRPLEIPRDTTQAVQKHRRWLAAVFIAGGAFSAFILATRFEPSGAVYLFNLSALRPAVSSWVVESGRWVLIVGNLVAVVVGVLLAFSPATLSTIESAGSSWFSERKLLKGADTQYLSIDKWVAAYPRRAGVIITVGALLMMSSFGIMLLGTH